jgi:Holliday junction resolvase RusA-like endonuclease
MYTDAKTRSEETVIRDMARHAMGNRTPFQGPVVLTMTAFRQIPASFSKRKHIDAESGRLLPTTKPDADNILKCADALNGIVFRDDSQVITAIIHKRYSDRPRLRIEVQAQPELAP